MTRFSMTRFSSLTATALAIVPAIVVSALAVPGSGQDADGRGAHASVSAQPRSLERGATLPHGATAIREIYGDWTVDCKIADGARFCALSQSRRHADAEQINFTVELRAPREGRSDGVIRMPFGLRLSDGAALSVDERPLGRAGQYSHCIPQGCLLLVSFSPETIEAMKAGTTLTITALRPRSSEPVPFPVSLSGFAAAIARAEVLDR